MHRVSELVTIRLFILGTDAARGHQPRFRAQPTRQQQSLRDIFPAEQAAGRIHTAASRSSSLRPSHARAARTRVSLGVPWGSVKIRQPRGALAQMRPEVSRIEMVDREVTNIRIDAEKWFWRRTPAWETRSFHLRPAPPAVVEPPIVMMRNERNAALVTGPHKFSRQERLRPMPRLCAQTSVSEAFALPSNLSRAAPIRFVMAAGDRFCSDR